MFAEARLHLVTHHLRQAAQQRRLVGRAEQIERVLVHVDDADFADAALHEFLVHVGEDAEVGDAPVPHLVDQPLDPGEVLHPERHRRVREQPARIVLAAGQQAPRVLAVGDVLGRDQHARPGVFVARQDRRLELDVEPVAGQRIVHRVAGELGLALPELGKFLDVGQQHVVAEDAVDIADQVVEVRGGEQAERLAVDLKQADAAGAVLHPGGMAGQMVADRRDAGPAPGIEQRFHAAVVLEPERDRRQFEDIAGIGGLLGE